MTLELILLITELQRQTSAEPTDEVQVLEYLEMCLKKSQDILSIGECLGRMIKGNIHQKIETKEFLQTMKI